MRTRFARLTDWGSIVALGELHARNAGLTGVRIPPFKGTSWTVAEHEGQIVSALGVTGAADDSTFKTFYARICLFWNPGRASTLGSFELMREVTRYADSIGRELRFLTLDPPPSHLATRAFTRFGFRYTPNIAFLADEPLTFRPMAWWTRKAKQHGAVA